MALFGGPSRGSLVDARTEEEKRRALEQLMNPLGSKSPWDTASGGHWSSSSGPFPADASPLANAPQSAPMQAGSMDLLKQAMTPGRGMMGAPRLGAEQSSLDGAWGQFDPSTLPSPQSAPMSRPPANAPRLSTALEALNNPPNYNKQLGKIVEPPHESTFQKIAAVALPLLMAVGGNQAGANNFINARMRLRQKQQDDIRAAHMTALGWQRQDQQARQRLLTPDRFTVGRDRMELDPGTNEVHPIYQGAQDWESYAETLGLQPGTPQYADAARDFVLRSNGPTALNNNKTIDDYRTSNRLKMEGVRQNDRMTVRQTPTYRDVNAPPPTYRDLHPREPAARQSAGSGGGGGGSHVPTATGPNGQKLFLRGGRWVDEQGRPAQ